MIPTLGSASFSESERRRSGRYEVQGPADFGKRHWYRRRGRILNLGLDGCLIEPRRSTGHSPGDSTEIRFEVNRIRFDARVIVRSVYSDGLLGVELVEMSEACRTRLLTLIDEMHAGDD
jgi:hypothetical protein